MCSINTGKSGMRLIGKPRLEQFKAEHPETRGLLDAWRAEVEHARWLSSEDVLARYALAEVDDVNATFHLMESQIRVQMFIRYESQIATVLQVSMNDEVRQAA